MRSKISVAAVQMQIKALDIEANLRKIEFLLTSLFKKHTCNLVVFPEDCITGPIPYNLELVQNNHSQSILFFKRMAKKFKTYIVCGSFIKKIGGKFFNTSLLINTYGTIILEYHKNNLWHPERKYLSPGKNIKTVKTPIGTIGIIICWDLAFPETCRNLAKQGVDIICCPSYWTIDDAKKLHKKYGKTTEHFFVNTLCPARAVENQSLFIYANGAEKAEVKLKSKIWTSDQIGQSQICSPLKGTVTKIRDNSEGWITYEFDRQILKDSENNYKLREIEKLEKLSII